MFCVTRSRQKIDESLKGIALLFKYFMCVLFFFLLWDALLDRVAWETPVATKLSFISRAQSPNGEATVLYGRVGLVIGGEVL